MGVFFLLGTLSNTFKHCFFNKVFIIEGKLKTLRNNHDKVHRDTICVIGYIIGTHSQIKEEWRHY